MAWQTRRAATESPPSSAKRDVDVTAAPSSADHADATIRANASPRARVSEVTGSNPAPAASVSSPEPAAREPSPSPSLFGGGGAPHFATTDLAALPVAVVGKKDARPNREGTMCGGTRDATSHRSASALNAP